MATGAETEAEDRAADSGEAVTAQPLARERGRRMSCVRAGFGIRFGTGRWSRQRSAEVRRVRADRPRDRIDRDEMTMIDTAMDALRAKAGIARRPASSCDSSNPPVHLSAATPPPPAFRSVCDARRLGFCSV